MFEAPPHRCEPRHNPGFGEIRCECALSARNGRSGQNPNCGTTNTKNAADARLMHASTDRRAVPTASCYDGSDSQKIHTAAARSPASARGGELQGIACI